MAASPLSLIVSSARARPTERLHPREELSSCPAANLSSDGTARALAVIGDPGAEKSRAEVHAPARHRARVSASVHSRPKWTRPQVHDSPANPDDRIYETYAFFGELDE